MRCEAAVALGGAYWSQGEVLRSQHAFSQARATALQSGHPAMAVPSSCYVAEQQTKRGQLHAAEATYQQALSWATLANGRLLPVAGFPLIKLGDLAREWNDLARAGDELQRGMELCRQLGQADVLVEGLVMWARLCLAQGDRAETQKALGEADQITSQASIDPWIATWADECRVRLWLSTGNLQAALTWVKERGLASADAFSYQHDLSHILLARVRIAAAQAGHKAGGQTGAGPALGCSLHDLLDLLARLEQAVHTAGWVHEQIQVLCLQALTEQLRGHEKQALSALARALELAAPGGYVRTFVDHGTQMARLLRQAAAQGVQRSYAETLIAAGNFAKPGDRSETPEPQPLIEPLSEREIEVLALIAQGLTNRNVAERLYISLGTVKAHTSNIYAKLGVRSRTQAVARARALAILQ
jgi:LuxR family maltose regulon positive regulatory protein